MHNSAVNVNMACCGASMKENKIYRNKSSHGQKKFLLSTRDFIWTSYTRQRARNRGLHFQQTLGEELNRSQSIPSAPSC